ncbi:hypothetical protein Lal_00028378, partial [Lupinus albus]
SHFILKESLTFLTYEEIEAREMTSKIFLSNHHLMIVKLGDDDAQLNCMENVNLNKYNVGQALSSNDEEMEPLNKI